MTVLEAMRGLEFFRDFDEQHLQELQSISRLVDFNPLSTIFKENEPATDVYLIVSGKASLATCTPSLGCRKLMDVADGDLLGWSALVGRTYLSDTAQTLTATSAIAINGEQLLALCEQHPRLGFRFMLRAAEVLAARLNATRLQLLALTGHQFPQISIESD